jgi:regulator of sirC expression with transglutaminase-like and TPR domain
MDDLKLMVERCDQAIVETPDQADLHRDRALILTLLGDQARACNDVDTALSLLNRSSQPVDPMLLHELKVRQTTCKQSRTMAGSD